MSQNLIFPRVKPYGTSGSTRASIRDQAAYPTEVVDYLKLSIYKHQKGGASAYSQKSSAEFGSGGIEKSLYLYLPPGLNERYSAKYEGKNLGAVGKAALNAATDVIDSGGSLEGDSFGKNLSNAAKAAKPALGFKLGADVISGAVGQVSPYGFSLDANDLSQITQGKVFNPYEEMLFKGVGFMLSLIHI